MRLFIIIILLIYCNPINSQNIYNYLGTIIVDNSQAMSFKLELTEKDGLVNGYSLTNIGQTDETKSEITGLYFKSDKSFQLQETQIIYTNSEAPLNTFCYINMNLSFKSKFNKKHLKGNFRGNFLDSTECANGTIFLMEEKKIKKKIKKIQKKINKVSKDTNLLQKTRVLKDGDDFTINWKKNNITLFVWDANQQDGDKIDLKINNDFLLHDFVTKNKKKKIKYKLKKGTNIIEIIAVNEGKSPPNTSRIELIDKTIKYPIITQLEVGKSAIIKIIK
tara:strand:+ start:1120 stop:1950 length:831 start_codon:yes stop_codon:yes gene_type:complete